MRAVIRRHLLVITALLAGGLCGCATPPPADDADAVADFNEANDPLEPTNRALYAFNNGLDAYEAEYEALPWSDALKLSQDGLTPLRLEQIPEHARIGQVDLTL